MRAASSREPRAGKTTIEAAAPFAAEGEAGPWRSGASMSTSLCGTGGAATLNILRLICACICRSILREGGYCTAAATRGEGARGERFWAETAPEGAWRDGMGAGR